MVKTKKLAELEAVEKFLRLIDQSIAGEPLARESPDFQFHLTTGALIGLEVTELADRTIAAGTSALRRLTADLRERLARDELYVSIHLSVTEGGAQLLASRDTCRGHVEGLVQLVRKHLGENRGAWTYRQQRSFRWEFSSSPSSSSKTATT